MARQEQGDESVVVIERGGSPVAAFLMGVAVGAGVALLLAPQSGAETRADIAQQARRAKDAAGRAAGTVRDRTREAYSAARGEVGRRFSEAREGVEHAMDEVRSRVDAGREAGRAAARAARDELKRRMADADATAEPDGEHA
jgi:gas vesicle protein